MITRAIVENIDREKYLLQIRIPLLDGIANKVGVATEQLRWAPYLFIPGISIDYRIGDVVVVAFEDNAYNQPLVLGFLRLNKPLESDDPRIDISVNNMLITQSLQAPKNSLIGNINYSDLQRATDI